MTLNELYKSYQDAPESALDELLQSVIGKALTETHDEDLAQDITLAVWQQLPKLTIAKSFNGWLSNYIYWRKHEYRRKTPTQLPLIHNAEGEPLNADDTIDYLASHHYDSDESLPIPAITDPVLQHAATFLIMGYSTTEAAEFMSADGTPITADALRQRLRRYRMSH
jgi:DNA-directed RNA polymerase specialized sigma24 family protein